MRFAFSLIVSVLIFSVLAGSVSAALCAQGNITSNCECGALTYRAGYCCNTAVDPIWFDPYYERWFDTQGCPSSYVYVDQNHGACDDNSTGPGNETQPYCSLMRATAGDANRVFTPSLAAQPGDVVLVKAGEYYGIPDATEPHAEPAYQSANNGNPTYPIIYRSYPGHHVNLTSYKSVVGGRYGTNYVIWDGFTLFSDVSTPGIISYRSGSHDNVAMNNEIIGKPGALNSNECGVHFEGADGHIHNITIRNNLLYGFVGIPGDDNVDGINLYYFSDSIFENNEIHSSNVGIFPKGGPSSGNIYRYNLIYNVSTSGFRIMNSGNNLSKLYQNIIYDNLGVGGAGFYLGSSGMGHTSNFKIYNNLVYDSDNSGLTLGVGNGISNGDEFVNNIFSDSPGAIRETYPGDYEFFSDYNNFYGYSYFQSGGGTGDLNWWQTTIGQDLNSTEADPMFVDAANLDFHLDPSSPLRNAGIDVWDYDNDGNTTERINMGPYITGDEVIGIIDYVVSGPPQPPTCESSGTCWHVSNTDPACDDAGPGNWSVPFCTINASNTYHQSGDHVYIMPGEYRESIIASSGLGENQHTVYSGYGTREEVKILGSDNVTGWNQCNPGIDPCNSTNVYYASFTAEQERWWCGTAPIPGFPDCGNPSTYPCCKPEYSGTTRCLVRTTDCWEDRQRWYIQADLYDRRHDPSRSAADVDAPGKYYYDHDASLVYVWPYDSQNASGHLIECSKRNPAILNNNYLTFQNTTVMHSIRQGLVLGGAHDINIINNEIAFNSGVASCFDNPAAIYHGKADDLAQNVNIIGNKIHDQGSDKGPAIDWEGDHAGTATTLYSISDSIMKNNEMYHVEKGIYIKSGWEPVRYNNITVTNNTVYDSAAGIVFGYAGAGSTFAGTIEDNLIYNTDSGIVTITDNKNLLIYGNTLWNTRGILVGYLDPPGDNHNIVNNVMASGERCFTMGWNSVTTTYSDYNLCYNTSYYVGTTDVNDWYTDPPGIQYYTLSDWRTGTGLDWNSTEQEPLFLSTDPASLNFLRPALGSPAIDAGEFIPGYHCDASGGTTPEGCRVWYGAAPDIGAFEYVSGAPPPPCANVNGDSIVNIIDLVLVTYWQGKSDLDLDWDNYDHLDVTQDGVINFADVSSVISSFGRSC